MRRIGIWLAVAGLGLSTISAPATGAPPGTTSIGASLGQVSLVPLDDRPFTSVAPLHIATIGGVEAVTPDRGLLGNFLNHGDPDAVGEWWTTSVATTEASVVAIPMMAYGGLVASRACASDLDTAMQRLERLTETKASHPDHTIYAFDVIQRLTIEPTSGYPGMHSGDLRRWAELYDKVENLGMEELRADLETVAAAIPDEVLGDYLCARARNHAVNKAMIEAAADGTIDFLILGQDDASEFGPHRAEKLELQRLVVELDAEDVVKIYPGADVLGAMLMAKYIIGELNATPTVEVQWSRTPGDDWVAPYQDIPYGTLINEYIETLGAQRTDDSSADVLLMANTAGGGTLMPFVEQIEAAVAQGRLVAIGDDAIAGVMDRELVSLIAPRVDHAELGGWSGWNIGVSLTQAVVRSALLEASRNGELKRVAGGMLPPPRQAELLWSSAHSHLTLLLQEAIHTDLYRNYVRSDVQRFATDAGDDPQHMTQVLHEANELAADNTRPLAERFFAEEFEGITVGLGFDGARERFAAISPLESLDLALAWPRYQEMHVEPSFTLDESSEKDVVLVAAPSAFAVSPDYTGPRTVELVVRNRAHATTQAKLEVDLPDGWTADVPASVKLESGEAITIPVMLSWAPLDADSSELVTFTAQTPGGDKTVTTVEVSAEWFNHALAANGAVASASSEWRQYTVDRVNDGNVTSVGSRWISETEPEPWVVIEFPHPATVDRVSAYHYGGYVMTDFDVHARVDGEWQLTASVSGNAEAYTETIFEPVLADAIRLDAIKTRDQMVRLYEIQVTCQSAGCA